MVTLSLHNFGHALCLGVLCGLAVYLTCLTCVDAILDMSNLRLLTEKKVSLSSEEVQVSSSVVDTKEGSLESLICEFNNRISKPDNQNVIPNVFSFRELGPKYLMAKCYERLKPYRYIYIFNTTFIYDSCFSDSELLVLNYSSVHRKPFLVYEIDDFAISTDVRLEEACSSMTVEYRWTLSNVTGTYFPIIQNSTFTADNSFPLTPTSIFSVIERNFSANHKIPFPRDLWPGIYNITVRAYLVNGSLVTTNATSDEATAIRTPWHFDSLFLEYKPLPLVITLGGELSVLTQQKNITLRAIDVPFNSDANTTKSQIIYRWSVTKCNQRFASGFDPTVNLYNAIFENIQFNISSVRKRSYTISNPTAGDVFVIVALARRSDSSEYFHASQVLFVVQEAVLNITIQCIFNCYPQVNVHSHLSVHVGCPGCTPANMSTAVCEWKLFQLLQNGYVEPHGWKNWTKSSNSTCESMIDANRLQPGKKYRIFVNMTLADDEVYSVATYEFITALPPSDGSCKISPDTGNAVVTSFSVRCESWLDDGQIFLNPLGFNLLHFESDFGSPVSFYLSRKMNPLAVNCLHAAKSKECLNGEVRTNQGLKYLVLQLSENLSRVLSYGVEHIIPDLKLSVGDSENGYNSTIAVRIYDLFYSYTEYTMTVTVLPPDEIKTSSDDIIPIAENLTLFAKKTLGRVLSLRGALQKSQLLNLVASLTSAINNVYVTDILSVIDFNPKAMQTGRFIDFQKSGGNSKGRIEGWEQMSDQLKNSRNKLLTKTNKKIITSFYNAVIHIDEEEFEDEFKLLQLIQTFSVIINNRFYVTVGVLNSVIDFTELFLSAAVNMTERRPVHLAMLDLIEALQKLLDNILQALKTKQIVLASAGIKRKNVRNLIQDAQRFVSEDIISQFRTTALLGEGERYYILLKTYLSALPSIEARRVESSKKIPSVIGYSSKIGDMMASIRFYTTVPKENVTPPSINTTVRRDSVRNIIESEFEQEDAGFVLRDLGTLFNESVILKATTMKKNPFLWDADRQSSMITSQVLSLKVSQAENESQTNDPASIMVAFKNRVTMRLYRPRFTEDDDSRMFYHILSYRSVRHHICMRLSPLDSGLGYEVFFRLGAGPNNDSFDYRTAVSIENKTEYGYQVCVSPGHILGNGTVYIGLKPFIAAVNISEADPSNETEKRLVSQYDFGVATLSCMSWSSREERWDEERCKPQMTDRLYCHCEGLTEIAIANSFYVPPNTIDFSTVFRKFDIVNNGSVFGLVVGLLCLYALVLLWARWQDREDEKHWSLSSLADNCSADTCFYMMCVHTGLRMSAGTRSKISFILVGEEQDTGIRVLNDGVRQEFRTSSVVKLLMSTSHHLGDLLYLRIWHDNTGESGYASWYLNKIEIEDFHTMESYVFISNSWLSVDKDDGTVHQVLFSYKKQHLTNFTHLFYEQLLTGVTDTHIWLSAVFRPIRSNFSRVQRVSCCAALLYLTMISNAMFFRSDSHEIKPSQLVLGPFRFSLRQIYVSMFSIFITVPPLFLIMLFFRNSRSRRRIADLNDSRIKMSRDAIERIFKDQTYRLPYWCIFIAWFLVLASIVVSGFFLILYSMEWGKTNSEQWLTTFFLSTLESFCIVDPIKVVIIAVFLSLSSGLPEIKNIEHLDKLEILREIRVHFTIKKGHREKIHPTLPLKRPEVEAMRKRRLHILWMKNLIFNFFIYSIFFWTVASITFYSRNTSGFYIKNVLHQALVVPPYPRFGFPLVNSAEFLYRFLNATVYPVFFPDDEDFGKTLYWKDKIFLVDKENTKVGPLRLRQSRVAGTETCAVERVGSLPCFPSYSILQEDTKSYCIGWKPMPAGGCHEKERRVNFSADAWEFTPSSKIMGYPIAGLYNTYGGGGYIMELDVNKNVSKSIQEELFRNFWIDRQTRAVFLEFTLYNANKNLFVYGVFLAEFLESGGVVPYHSIYSMDLHDPKGRMATYILVCKVVFVFSLLLFFINFVRNIVQSGLRFFAEFWNCVDVLCLVLGACAGALYVVWTIQTRQILAEFHRDPRSFVNFYHVVVWSETMAVCLAVLIFFIILRLSCLLGCAKRMNSLALIIKLSAKDLMGVGLIFVIFSLAYAQFGYYIFGNMLDAYRSMLKSLASIFLFMLGKIQYKEMNAVSPFFGRIYFLGLVFTGIFLILKMFEAVLNESISSNSRDDEEFSGLSWIFQKMYVGGRKPKESGEYYLVDKERLPTTSATDSNDAPTREEEFDGDSYLRKSKKVRHPKLIFLT